MEVRVARASFQRLPSTPEQLVTASKQRRFQPVAAIGPWEWTAGNRTVLIGVALP